MSFIKILVLFFAFFTLSRAFLRIKDKAISFKSGFFWITIWTIIIGITFYPKITDLIADFLGIDRGTDSSFFIAILIIFYLLFRLYIKIDKVDKDLTHLVIELSKKTKVKKYQTNKFNK